MDIENPPLTYSHTFFIDLDKTPKRSQWRAEIDKIVTPWLENLKAAGVRYSKPFYRVDAQRRIGSLGQIVIHVTVMELEPGESQDNLLDLINEKKVAAKERMSERRIGAPVGYRRYTRPVIEGDTNA